MRNLKQICLIMISSLLVVFCHCFQVKSSESQANPGSTHTKTGEEIHFPTKSAPGLYVNTSPAFSVSYPSHWLEKTPESRFIFIAESPDKFPGIRVTVIPNMSTPLEYSAGFYFRALAKIGKDIKLINDKKIVLEDGSLAQEAEIEWIDNSGIKLNGLFLTAIKEDTWITIVLTNNKGRIDEDLKKIVYSLKIKPEEKAQITSKEISFPKISAPGLFVNSWPAFSVSYPINWLEKAPESSFIFIAESPEESLSLRILLIPNMSASLEYSANIFVNRLAKFGKDIKLIYDKQVKLDDGSSAQEAEIEWVDNSNIKVNGLFLTLKKEDNWIVIILTNNKGRVNEELKKIAYSLKVKPEEKVNILYKYKIPEQTDDGWQTAHISQVKIDEKQLTDLIGKILNGTYINIHSVLIIKNGKLVFEEYFPGQDLEKSKITFTRNDLHGVMSVTKSFTSTLIGIAIDKGLIKGTDEDLIAFFPEYEKDLRIDNKAGIKLKHVLSMTAGLDWDEWTYSYNDPRNSNWIMHNSESIIAYILNRSVKDQPGTKFTYNSGLSILLGTIIEKRSSLKIKEFAQKYLFGPLGISKYEWGYLDQAGKVPDSQGGLYLRPRDMAKSGYLFLKKGNWEGKQIISSKWIEEATSEHIKLSPGIQTGYGHQWWLYKFEINNKIIEAYSAIGRGGQHIFVFPSLDAVVVLTAGNYFVRPGSIIITNSMVNHYILPAIISPK
jgi:CubicO group peptidase (beta-lactamase class C family)